MRAVYIVALCYLILIAPIFISVYTIFDSLNKKLYFSFNVFGLNLFGGYVVLKSNKLYIHTKDKAKIVNILDYLTGNSKLDKINVSIVNIKSVVVLGVNNSNNLYLGGMLYSINQSICPIIKAKKRYLSVKNDLAFTNDENIRVVARIGLILGLFDLILLAFNKIIKGIKYGKRKRKQS